MVNHVGLWSQRPQFESGRDYQLLPWCSPANHSGLSSQPPGFKSRREHSLQQEKLRTLTPSFFQLDFHLFWTCPFAVLNFLKSHLHIPLTVRNMSEIKLVHNIYPFSPHVVLRYLYPPYPADLYMPSYQLYLGIEFYSLC